jgi:hypothetical protein
MPGSAPYLERRARQRRLTWDTKSGRSTAQYRGRLTANRCLFGGQVLVRDVPRDPPGVSALAGSGLHSISRPRTTRCPSRAPRVSVTTVH